MLRQLLAGPIVFGMVSLGAASVAGQETPSTDRAVSVNGRSMHLWSSDGLAQRPAGRPVIILESGVPGTTEMWRPIFNDVSRVAPVVAYDRSGLGKSDYDGERPTVAHVAENLHRVLSEAHISPPYVLVGASWGGVFIRGFAAQYPQEVVGLVFLDVTDYERTCDELKAVLPNPNCPPPVPTLPDSVPAGVRAELTQVVEYGARDFADIRALRVSPDVPVAVVVGGQPIPLPPNALTSNKNALRLLQVRHQADWALSSRAGLLLVSTDAGHDVVHDAPSLVLQAIKYVLDHDTPRTK
jgi:pimeloyl-ACP methyl ester carboxylesterase